ncbi:phosphatidylinositide phosphatase SAC2 isoform X2 [Bradysia coprophila]|uniref:phosphatidylinositide phosphatase SAC2 isoform X2 n=1 Tax=Bradysia coprophila TaxID=38358 RepID=UPI00187D9945|nr:phosphatidylinositide phosphatase SAC2 isoform X2 [Bradysia coprophila]
MEVFQTDKYYIFVKQEKSLWWNRKTSEFTLKSGWDLSCVGDIECIGVCGGIIGIISLPGVYDPHLIVIKESTAVGVLYPPHLVYKIKSICMLSDDEPDALLANCPRHNTVRPTSSSPVKSRLLEGTNIVNKSIWGAVKSAGSTIKNTTQQAAALASNQMKSTVGIKDPTRVEKRITDEFHKIFDDTDSFYYCLDGDITNNLQRRQDQAQDDRFFWNKYMLKDIFQLGDESWILPIIQGFVQMEQCVIGNECFTLALVSRRSRYRAGTRYKRRGVDENGNCANYVETEQILSFHQHQMSFTQIRGSVPVYWSQPGYKYRPPPRLDKDENETQLAFQKHFDQELSIYNNVYIINLVEQCGKEKVIFDAYGNHILKYNSEKLLYVTFDFHEYCRGMRFENVSALIEALAPEAGAMGFYWKDSRGHICVQKSVFRVNCMDCLDRTNVVQTAIGKTVLESQLVKLGLAPPYTPIPEQLKTPFMVLWANNGDVISRQYAGTNALKGDYTRTGERKFTGLVKDGMNSANRYYLARFKDTYRQATVDLMLGNQVSADSLIALGGNTAVDDTDSLIEGAEHARLLVEDCRRLLLGSAQYPVGAWGLIDADPTTGDPNETEVDCILLLTDEFYLVAEYDSHLDKIIRFEKVPLQTVTLIEFGLVQQSKMFQSGTISHLCIRLNYAVDGADGYFHMFRSPNIRFFNNVAVVINTQDEVMESLLAIIEIFRIALENCGKKDVKIVSAGTLQRRKSKVPALDVPKGIPRNLSESQLLHIGSKALSNVAGQFSKLGQSLKSTTKKPKNTNPPTVYSQQNTFTAHNQPTADSEVEPAQFTVGSSGKTNSDTSDSDDNDCSIYEPDVNDLVQENPIYNENTFLPSVGIVMGSNDAATATATAKVNSLETKDNVAKLSSDVCTMSISSVTDYVTMPAGMLENASPIRSRSPAPEIRVQNIGENESLAHSGGQSFSHSAHEMRTDAIDSRSMTQQKDLSLNLSSSQSENALKQLKTLTSPLSKLAKGMQNFGMNLDPRKITVKSPVSHQADEVRENERDKLQEMWDASKCKTKLIAL